jgi:hypothetical protein
MQECEYLILTTLGAEAAEIPSTISREAFAPWEMRGRLRATRCLVLLDQSFKI